MRRQQPSAPRAIIGYARVSTTEQALRGMSLADQQERLRAYATATGRELSEIIVDDGQSAKNLDRTGMTRILAAVRAGNVAGVVVLKLDRLTRSVRDLGELVDLFQSKGVDLISVTESLDTGSASGRMVMNMMATVAQWEREVIGERTSSVLAHMRTSRRVYGITPYGYARNGDDLVAVAEEQAVVAEMRMARAAGVSYGAIANSLNARGVRPHRGASWYASTIRFVLTSKIANETAAA